MCLNSQWMLYVYFLLEYTIQECSLDVSQCILHLIPICMDLMEVYLVTRANVSLQYVSSFSEKPHATNISLYPTMLSSTTCWILQIHMEDTTDFPLGLRHRIVVIILHFLLLERILNCRHLFFGTSLILIFLQAIVCDISYKSNAFVVWLETFHKENS